MIFFIGGLHSQQASRSTVGSDCLCQLMVIHIYKTIVHQSGMNILKAMDKSNCLCQIAHSPHQMYFMILPCT